MTVADAASRSWLHQPHTLVFFVAALVCLAVAVALPLLVNRERSWERRVYWAVPRLQCSVLSLRRFLIGS
ncbi:hypothetical protein I552_8374 [Mycobacterium xenopi 3993]|nr:hypothetical protein I552_8374 [Mycobacterium xenopi 3993]